MIRTPNLLTALLLAPVLAGAAAAAPAGMPLWQGAETGMTAAEVGRAFPEAEVVPENERAGERGPDQGELRVRIHRVEVAGAPYRARFYFTGSGLERVILDRQFQGEVRFSRGLKLAGRVREALSRHYGEPVERQTGSSGYLVTWRKGAKAVRLVVITKSYKVKSFQVIFEPATAE